MPLDPDDEPTSPCNPTPDASATVLARLYGELCPLDRKKLAKLVEAWFVAPLERRILIEEVAFALVKAPSAL